MMEGSLKAFHAVGGLFFVFLMLQTSSVECVVASEWSIGPAEEYTMAWINITYINPKNGKLHTENTEAYPGTWGIEPKYCKKVGKFGMGKVNAASGQVVHVRSKRMADGKYNHFGCEPFADPIPEGPWIALVKRGNCNFDRKLENAQARNAVAMVVYDLEDRDSLEKMGLSNCRNCSIPGVFTYKRVGEEIANVTDGGTRVDMFITVGETCTRPYSGINRTSVLFVSISFIVLMIISLAWLVFYYVQRFRYLHAKDRLAQRLCSAAKKALAKIPTRNIKCPERDLSGEAECCAVCIEFYSLGDLLRTLPCRHEFHKACVDPWLLEHRTCPMCKMDILKYYGFIFTGSQESILHMDMEDGAQSSAESRDADSPVNDEAPHNQAQRYSQTEQVEHVDEHPHSSTSSSVANNQQEGSIRKPSLISLTVVAAPRGHVINTTGPADSTIVTVPEGYNAKVDKNRPFSHLETADDNSSSPVNFRHPMCNVHGEKDMDRIPEKTTDKKGVVSVSHQLLIHREGSFHQNQCRPDFDHSPTESQIPNEELQFENLNATMIDLAGVKTPCGGKTPDPDDKIFPQPVE